MNKNDMYLIKILDSNNNSGIQLITNTAICKKSNIFILKILNMQANNAL